VFKRKLFGTQKRKLGQEFAVSCSLNVFCSLKRANLQHLILKEMASKSKDVRIRKKTELLPLKI